jgi:hypothetical protein
MRTYSFDYLILYVFHYKIERTELTELTERLFSTTLLTDHKRVVLLKIDKIQNGSRLHNEELEPVPGPVLRA